SKKISLFKVFYRNEDEFKRIYKEIFINQEYKFSSKTKSPLIIDCGSHMGLSILYFKSIYPDSEIIGFEPNPENFQIIQKNIKENELSNVKVFNYALSDREGVTDLHVSFNDNDPWTWGDTIVYNMWSDKDNDKKVAIKTVKLSKYINRPVDLIKIDIEGSEQKVLEEIENKLHFIKEIVMEYHGTKTGIKVNDYSVIKHILERNKFNIKTTDKDLRIAFSNFVANLRKTSSVFSVRAVKKDL
ncbi:MAG: FkbM family methyltransferase, partial [Ignavibacteria bacterium]|nr:FkbM family methyltransferase [Ignavibacteria bacterium]